MAKLSSWSFVTLINIVCATLGEAEWGAVAVAASTASPVRHQAKLQRNLMYLAAIADSQPQAPSLHPQYHQGGMMQQPGGHYMQQQISPQSLMAARSSSMMYSQHPYPSLQHQQQTMHGPLGVSSSSGASGLHMLNTSNNNVVASGMNLGGGFPEFGRKQDVGVSGGSSGGDGDGGETLYLKSPEKGSCSEYGLSLGTLKVELFSILLLQEDIDMKISELAPPSSASNYDIYPRTKEMTHYH
ncbi:hypothetical protein SSX86_002732 [Deinandra increscens subsp. villosa]|uniref:Uncharacterized protein n=1 Tax=Deinandra increscens subsp. villosa TaxID=3103831 RepID=A0AAP0HDG9_9ASTR